MLAAITLENYALANHLEVDFTSGFNVITGETGAGKSLILDALALATGARADVSKVRFGCNSAQIFVDFNIANKQEAFADWFSEQGEEPCEQLLIRRQIMASGGSKAWLNGKPISINELKSLGNKLVQMHSQHAQTALLKPAFMCDWLDSVGQPIAKTQTLKETMNSAWHKYQQLAQAIASSDADNAARKARIHLLNMQLEDVQCVQELVYSEIEQEHETLSNYEELMHSASQLLNLLDGEEVSCRQLVAQATKVAEQETENSFEQAANHLHNAMAELDEATAYIRDFADKPAPDAQKLQQLDQHLNDFHRLARKYSVKPQEIQTLVDDWSKELLELESIADAQQNHAKLGEYQQDFIKCAKKLDTARKKVAPQVSEMILKNLRPLAFENAQCEFSFTDFSEANAKGISDVQFLFSANKGMPLQDLKTQASGGELSRLALVMQVINARHDQQALMVFDEIDVGMSGGTAEIIGQLMQSLGDNQQILTITHQAQVASKAVHHLLVSKHDIDDVTHSTIVPMFDEDRVQELARMAGGINITESTLAHARSLID